MTSRTRPSLTFAGACLACVAATSCGARTDLGEPSADDGRATAPVFAQLVVADRDRDRNSGGRLLSYDTLEGGDFAEIDAGPFTSPCSPTFDAEGRVLFVDTAGARVVRLDPRSGAIEPTDVNLEGLGAEHPDLAVDGDGGFYVTAGEDAGIVHVDSIGSAAVLFSSPGLLGRPTGVGVSPDGKIVIVDGGNRRIAQMDDMTGAGFTSWEVFPGTVPQGDEFLFNLAFDDAGRMYFADGDGLLHRIDDISGRGHVTFGATGDDGAPLGFRGVSIGPDGRIYLTVQSQLEVDIWSIADMEGNDRVELAKPDGGRPRTVCGGPAVR